MNQIEWCCSQKSGIRIIEPNENLSDDYILKGEDSLKVMIVCPSENWRIISAYYSCYNCLYALLQKVGIKSEIHKCTISLMPFFNFSNKEIVLLNNLKDKRINVQYYNKKETLVSETDIKEFVLRCKEMLHKLDFINIRKNILKEINKNLKS